MSKAEKFSDWKTFRLSLTNSVINSGSIADFINRYKFYKNANCMNTPVIFSEKQDTKKCNPVYGLHSLIESVSEILCNLLEQRLNLAHLVAELLAGLEQIVDSLACMKHCRVVATADVETNFRSRKVEVLLGKEHRSLSH